jgi:hypothetical protein
MCASTLIVGSSTCPHCLQGNIQVVNDGGQQGDPRMNYLENHFSAPGTLCPASEKMLTEL